MARFKVLLVGKDGSQVGELTVDALWSSDAVALAERAAEDLPAQTCGYEVWRGQRKIARRPPPVPDVPN